ncbi:DUF4476 domain-containing protein [Pedobacter gandavensis]|uniref:DUF4476 domain-containing protein n=1 Tax=Pedobacter gandavensis TaxID=2679963 RepID=UPI00293171AF|nr:DUF4476 domain-containing protein [Pedobacter gandavensis]
MKKLLFLFAVLLQTTFSFAQNGRGSSELFIEIPARGNYVVYVDNEFAGSAYGRFRFYDIRNNFATVVVMKDSTELLRKRVNVPMNARLIVRYSQKTGWRPIATLNLYDQGQYALDNWDRPLMNNRPGPGPGLILEEVAIMTPSELELLLPMIRKGTFTDDKKQMIKVALKNTMVTADQLIPIIKTLNSETDRVEAAIKAYPSVVDKNNFYKIAGILNGYFEKKEIMDFIEKQP